MAPKLRSYLIVGFLTAIGGSALAGSMLCPKEEIIWKGGSTFRRSMAEASHYLGPVTSNIDQTTVYVTVENGALYAQCNYQARGASHASKLATDDQHSIAADDLVYNLVFEEVAGDTLRH